MLNSSLYKSSIIVLRSLYWNRMSLALCLSAVCLGALRDLVLSPAGFYLLTIASTCLCAGLYFFATVTMAGTFHAYLAFRKKFNDVEQANERMAELPQYCRRRGLAMVVAELIREKVGPG